MVSFGRTRQEGVSKLNGPALLVLTSLASGPIAALPEEDRRRPYEITPAGAALFREVIADMNRIVDVGRARLAFLPESRLSVPTNAIPQGGVA